RVVAVLAEDHVVAGAAVDRVLAEAAVDDGREGNREGAEAAVPLGVEADDVVAVPGEDLDPLDFTRGEGLTQAVDADDVGGGDGASQAAAGQQDAAVDDDGVGAVGASDAEHAAVE